MIWIENFASDRQNAPKRIACATARKGVWRQNPAGLRMKHDDKTSGDW